jgi:alkylhydroperoxidase/carboxymuconolactone decarboxylase family protein YurZ
MRASRSKRERALAPLLSFAAAMAARDAASAGRALVRARHAGIPRRAAEETALMLMLYAGYPAALEGVRVLAERWPGRARRSREGTPADWRRRGAALCRRVYGAVYPRLVSHVRAMHPDLAVWMVEQGYGRVLSRPRFGLTERELVAVAVLAACGWERKLKSHLLGSARVGARPAEVRAAFRIGLGHADRRGRAACARAWREADLFGTSGARAASKPRHVDRPNAPA